MDGTRFDELSRRFATRQTRRSVLGLIGAALTGGALRERGTEAARRPPRTPNPLPTCPGQQHWSDGWCVCPSGLSTCGPDCCNDDEPRVLPNGTNNPNYSECCDNACCFGMCYGEELCCPSSNTWCEATQECCPSDRPYCCGAGGCCPSPCCETNAGLACCDITPECAVAADCAGVDSECQARTCTGGICGVVYTPYGSPVSNQISGDCHSNVCDGAGGIVSIVDDSDVPVVTGDCATGSCANGVPGTVPRDCAVCNPGQTQSCYSGPGGTAGVGVCRAGTQTCRSDGSGFDACFGEVLPSPETCNGLDDDCDGTVDDNACSFSEECRLIRDTYRCCIPFGWNAGGDCSQCCAGRCRSIPFSSECAEVE